MVDRVDAGGTLRLTALVSLLTLQPIGCGDREGGAERLRVADDAGCAQASCAGGGGTGGAAGAAGSSGTGAGTAGSAGTGGVAGTAGSAGTGGRAGTAGTGGTGPDPRNPAGCPPEAPAATGLTTCSLASNVRCAYVHQCNSGGVRFQYLCRSGRFDLVPEACARPYDSCAGTALHCDQQWVLNLLGPPDSSGPCPTDRPVDGAECALGGPDKTWPQCGYACDPNTAAGGWTVVECMTADRGWRWQSDGACR